MTDFLVAWVGAHGAILVAVVGLSIYRRVVG